MQLSQLLKMIAPASDHKIPVAGVTLDSRQVCPGDLFLAYPGLETDGRDYILSAIDRGAVAVLYDPEGYDVAAATVPLIPISSLAQRVGHIAAEFYHHPSQKMQVLGITGTNGKTSCTQYLAQALDAFKRRCAVMGTLGYGFLPHLSDLGHTTPDPVQCQRALSELYHDEAEWVAMEVSSHALIQHRVDGVHFDIGVFTQLSQDHLDYHGDMQSYGEAKALLFQQPGMRYGVINADDRWGRTLIDRYKKTLPLVGYTLSTSVMSAVPAVVATDITMGASGFSARVQTPWGIGDLVTPLHGYFNISNVLAILAVLCLRDFPLKEVLMALNQLQPARGRMEWVSGRTSCQPRVVVDYAHNPGAVKNILKTLREETDGRLICVLGCGGDRDVGKRPKMAAIAEQYADLVVLTSDNPRNESPMAIIQDMLAGLQYPKRALVVSDRAEAIRSAVQRGRAQDVVLVAGKGHETIQRIGQINYPFDDVAVVKQVLAS